jgi:hypothetical protein
VVAVDVLHGGIAQASIPGGQQFVEPLVTTKDAFACVGQQKIVIKTIPRHTIVLFNKRRDATIL